MEGMTQFNKVHDILDFHVNKNPDSITISIDNADYKTTDILSKVSSLVEFLRESKIKSGERIAFLAKNSSEFIELMYASSILELVMVPIHNYPSEIVPIDPEIPYLYFSVFCDL